ncbi:hypothetical protein Scep_019533 [Stephania cephalantha]|uniref:Pentatricopeptide repeat-containing protein n=1 Tax=Stephania cephalantha TaxID=152367 RepID=A0AAP0NN03_9MAGN
MITSGFVPTIFVTNCLIHMYIKCSLVHYAVKVFDQMPERDIVSWNSMIFAYSACGSMGIAHSLFESMTIKDVISWNSLISGYLQNGDYWHAICLFLEMGVMAVDPDRTTFAIVLKSCSALEDYDLGTQIHGLAIRFGIDDDVVTASALIDMYAKCKSLGDSHKVFLGMSEPNSVSWSAFLAGLVQNEQLIDSLWLFKEMQRVGVEVSQSTYASIFRSCAGLSSLGLGSQLHGHALKNNFCSDAIVGTAILDMYAKCDGLDDAWRVFKSLSKRNLQSWNAIVVGYARNDQGFEALKLFQLMRKSGIGIDEITLSGVFSACAMVRGNLQGTQVHALAIKNSYVSNTCVANAIVDMYGKCAAVFEASSIFYMMDTRDAVSWNAIIAAYEQNGHEEETINLYLQMLYSGMEPDEFTYGSVLKACAGHQAVEVGVKVHDRIVKSGLGLDLFVASALVDMYCKCGMMNEAKKLHNRVTKETLVSWNAIISGFSLQKLSEEAQKFFSFMLEMGLSPDNFTYATVLDTCANLATISLGKQIHACVIKLELHSDVYVSSALVDMYSKCGIMQDSHLVFKRMPIRDNVSWNALISGYAHHGLGLQALDMFRKMQQEDVLPNHATFLAVLRACGHVGLFDLATNYFHSMFRDYSFQPKLEHYSCMVDMMGRSGRVDEALNLIYEMPFEADDILWRTLLHACQIHGNVEVAVHAASSLLELDPNDSAAYILLSNVYAKAGMWAEVSNLRKRMRQSGLKKEPGCSWIEVKNEVHAFLVGDRAHPKCIYMYERLEELVNEMKWVGYVPNTDFILIAEEA